MQKKKIFYSCVFSKSKISLNQTRKKKKRDEKKKHLEWQLNNTTEKLNNYNVLNKIRNGLNEISYK